MSQSRQSVAQTIADVISWRPVLEPVLRAFEPALAAQAELAAELAGGAYDAGRFLPEWRADRAGQGLPLLAGADLAGTARLLRASAERLLPIMGSMQAVTPHAPALQAFFTAPLPTGQTANAPEDAREALASALIAGDRGAVERIAQNAGLEPLMLDFVFGFVLRPVLWAMARASSEKGGEAPWNDGELWQKGYCPVCGSLPSIGWLDKPMIDEKNAYLAGGGGKKHLHCGQCGASWRFRRGACPACAEEGNGVIEILRESGPSHGERLDWCTKCKGYCPTVDLREREFTPNLEAAAMGMMHLDMVAARKKLHPLKASFWNIF